MPRTFYEYDGDRIVATWTESEWDEDERDLAIALDTVERLTGPDGEWLPEATAPGGAPDVYESGYRYIGKGPFTNWHQKAKLDALDAHKNEAGEKANLNGVYFTAERIDFDVPPVSGG